MTARRWWLARCALASAATAGLLLPAACATRYAWQARVPLVKSAEPGCLAQALAQEGDVTGVTRPAESVLRFQLEGDDRGGSADPFELRAEPGGGEGGDGPPTLLLQTGFEGSRFAAAPGPRIHRARELVAALVERCTGRRPELGAEQPCGRGRLNDLCVDGAYF